jgi:uncharacterized protein
MIIEESFVVPAGREQVAAYLLDIERVSSCVPGVDSVTQTGEGRYDAVLRVQMGPIRSQFAGQVDVDSSAAPAHLTAVGQGRDQATGSHAQVSFAAELTEQPDGRTEVACRADVTIRGRLGQFGTGVITSTAKSLVREFAECASSTLGAPAPAGSEQALAAAKAPRMGRVVLRGLLLYVRNLLARLRDRFRRDPDSRGARGREQG